jgi:ABC-type Fe3+-hydroxamate transport system substrate-binding protein
MRFQDATGQLLTPLTENEARTARIASLVPSITELLVTLGLTDQLVARTGFCIHLKAAVEKIPKVGGTKDVQLEKLRALKPTHCIVNVDENTFETVSSLREFVPQVIVTHPCSPQDNLALFELLGSVFHQREKAHTLCTALTQALNAAEALRAQLPPRKVLYLIWREPWMTVARDTYISQMLALVNWHSLPAVNGGDGLHTLGAARYPKLDWSEAWLSEIEEVLLSSEPYSFTQNHCDEVKQLMKKHAPQARVRLIDGELCSWYGPRAIDGIHYLQNFAQQ